MELADTESHWQNRAACRGLDPEKWFPNSKARDAHIKEREAKRICQGCTVQNQCLLEALKFESTCGIFGGLNEKERGALIRGRRQVMS